MLTLPAQRSLGPHSTPEKDAPSFLCHWWLYLIPLCVLSGVFLALNLLFHGSVELDRAKLLEEGSKVIVAYVLSLLSLSFLLFVERSKTRRRVTAVRSLAVRLLALKQPELSALSSFDPALFAPQPISGLPEAAARRLNFQQRASLLAQDLRSIVDVLQSDPEAASMNGDLIESLSLFLNRARQHESDKSPASAQELIKRCSQISALVEPQPTPKERIP